MDLAAYRIIQESLTNAIRHAGPATATVALSYRDGLLLIEVADTGRGVPAMSAKDASGADLPRTGHGLAGMRERAAAAGGTLQAGPASQASGGGFAVTATLPYGRAGQQDDSGQDEAEAGEARSARTGGDAANGSAPTAAGKGQQP